MDTSTPYQARLAGPHADPLVRWLAAELGWYAVQDTGEAAWFTVADVAGAIAEPGPADVLLLTSGDGAVDAARAAVACAAPQVVSWPDDREALRAMSAQPPAPRAVDRIEVGGSSGGVGTTTVAAALAGLAAWQGQDTLLLSCPGGPLPDGAPTVAAEDLVGIHTWSASTVVPGVANLRCLGVVGEVAELDPGDAAMVLVDRGVRHDVDVLVVRRDRAGLDALARTTAAVVVVLDHGIAPPAAVRDAIGTRRFVVVPWSRRVARAGWEGRLPAGLPGTWLDTLRPVLG